MGMPYPEFVDNPENRCPVLLLVDTSASMEGAPLAALNAGLAAFKYDVEQDELAALRVELALITFGQDVTVVQEFIPVDAFTPRQFEASGKTPLGDALIQAMDLLEARKAIYRQNGVQYYRPWVFLITDGAPTDGELWQDAARRMRQLEAENRLSFFVIAVEGADMEILSHIAPLGRPPMALQDLRFEELFRWLSASVRRVSSTTLTHCMTALPSSQGWCARPSTNEITE